MKIITLLVWLVLFSWYFYGIWSWYLSFLPLVVFFLLFLGAFLKNTSFSYSNLFQSKTIFFVLWGMIMVALCLVLSFLGIAMLEVLFALLGVNILALLVGYIANISLAEDITYLSYLIVVLFLLGYSYFFPFSSFYFVDMLWYLSLFTSLFVGIICFVFSRYWSIAKYFRYHFFIIVLVTLFVGIFYYWWVNVWTFFVYFLFLFFLFMFFYYLSLSSVSLVPDREITVRKILAWERILPKLQKMHPSTLFSSYFKKYSDRVQAYLSEAPLYMKYFFESLNLSGFFGFLIMYFFVSQVSFPFFWWFSWLYWGICLLFLGNIFLLKSMNYISLLQKFGMFFWVNIVLYSVFFTFFTALSSELVLYLILANMFYSFFLFQLHAFFPMIDRNRYDYFLALGVDGFAVCINIFFLAQLDISGQIIFALAFLYIAIKVLLFFSLISKIPYLVQFHQEE